MAIVHACMDGAYSMSVSAFSSMWRKPEGSLRWRFGRRLLPSPLFLPMTAMEGKQILFPAHDKIHCACYECSRLRGSDHGMELVVPYIEYQGTYIMCECTYIGVASISRT